MVRPNFIPRTLIGVGGVRLFNIPGVIYPKEMLKRQPGVKKVDGRPFRKIPSWGITTNEAAVILGCTPAAARLTLHRYKVKYHIVITPTAKRFYWHKSQVERIVSDRLPEMRGVNPKLVTTQEALEILRIGRSTLHRYVKEGKLKSINVRYVPENSGARIRTYFVRSEVLKLAYRKAAMQRHALELDRLLVEGDLPDTDNEE